MAVQRTVTWNTGSNIFNTEDEYVTFMENFSDITDRNTRIIDQFILNNKITEFRREVGNNTITFITTFSSAEDIDDLFVQMNLSQYHEWLQGLGWSKISDVRVEI